MSMVRTKNNFTATYLQHAQHYEKMFDCSKDLFDLILYVPSTVFQLYRDGSSWVEPVLS